MVIHDMIYDNERKYIYHAWANIKQFWFSYQNFELIW